jgi:hypothetical protein
VIDIRTDKLIEYNYGPTPFQYYSPPVGGKVELVFESCVQVVKSLTAYLIKTSCPGNAVLVMSDGSHLVS